MEFRLYIQKNIYISFTILQNGIFELYIFLLKLTKNNMDSNQ